jgi:hypothetical protein
MLAIWYRPDISIIELILKIKNCLYMNLGHRNSGIFDTGGYIYFSFLMS